jgi:hypothetical protein
MRRSLWLVLAATLVTLAGCSSGVSGEPQRGTAGGNLAEALAVVPVSAGSAVAVDQAAMKERWGVTEVDSSTDPGSDAYREYLRHLAQYITAGRLIQYAAVMPEDYGWGWADVDWAVDITAQGEPVVTVYRLRDDLDMAVVTGSLDERYVRSGPDTRPVYEFNLKKTGSGTAFLTGATVLPDKHLVVAGADIAAVLDLIDGKSEGLAATATGQAMLAAVPDAEGVVVGWGAAACQNPQTLPRSAADVSTAATATAALGSVTWWAIGVVDETRAAVGAAYPDAGAAAADQPRRAELVTSGTSLVSGKPYAEVLGRTTVTAADVQLQYRMDAMERATSVVNMWAQRDAPWAFCGSG